MSFQFHKGTIKAKMLSLLVFLLPPFNSIKVQLRLEQVEVNSVDANFQFHKGTIKADYEENMILTLHAFNSIKVQLRRAVPVCSYVQSYHFQFHKGTIKAFSRPVPLLNPSLSIP